MSYPIMLGSKDQLNEWWDNSDLTENDIDQGISPKDLVNSSPGGKLNENKFLAKLEREIQENENLQRIKSLTVMNLDFFLGSELRVFALDGVGPS